MPTTIVIFDDEPRSITKIRRLVEQQLSGTAPFEILEATSLDELRRILDTTKVDVLIADIVMPEGQPSGIEVVSRYLQPGCDTRVIYVSGYLEQAPEVYVTEHVYFLLKPIQPDKLADALNKALATRQRRQPPMLRATVDHKERLFNAPAIYYLESDLHRVLIHCRDGVYVTYAKLSDLASQLPADFTRCHRSFVVNLAYVRSVDRGELYMNDGTRIPISRRYAQKVQADLLAYLSR